jgi:hypothetical protein
MCRPTGTEIQPSNEPESAILSALGMESDSYSGAGSPFCFHREEQKVDVQSEHLNQVNPSLISPKNLVRHYSAARTQDLIFATTSENNYSTRNTAYSTAE